MKTQNTSAEKSTLTWLELMVSISNGNEKDLFDNDNDNSPEALCV